MQAQSALYKEFVWTIKKDAIRFIRTRPRNRRTHSPHKQVIYAAEVNIIAVFGNPGRKIHVKSHGIEMILKHVLIIRHYAGKPLARVFGPGKSQMI